MYLDLSVTQLLRRGDCEIWKGTLKMSRAFCRWMIGRVKYHCL